MNKLPALAILAFFLNASLGPPQMLATPPIAAVGSVAFHWTEEQQKRTNFQPVNLEELPRKSVLSVCNPSDSIDLHVPLRTDDTKPYYLYLDFHGEVRAAGAHKGPQELHQPLKVLRLECPLLTEPPRHVQWKSDQRLTIIMPNRLNQISWQMELELDARTQSAQIVGMRVAIHAPQGKE